MPGRVFISCGQATADERVVASQIRDWFSRKGFDPYVAVQTQSVADVNSGIMKRLKLSDFYVFVDFRRERLIPVSTRCPSPFARYQHRGSLFTNQELAVVYLLEFEKVLFYQQEGLELNGLLRYMGANATRFSRPADVPALIERDVAAREWSPSYSRHLYLGNSRLSHPLRYGDHTGQRYVRVFYQDICNNRDDIGALNAVARLQHVISRDPTWQPTELDRSPLKCTGQPGYEQVIWPKSHACWDWLAICVEKPAVVYLNSALDRPGREPIISVHGEYELGYEVFAENFPVLRFCIDLTLTGDLSTTLLRPRPRSA